MKKNKEHKKGESTIGKIIYGFLLFMPLFAIGVTCGYAMFNKNAYLSKNKDSVQNVTEIQKNGTINDGITYYITYNESTDTNSLKINYSYISVDWTDYGVPQNEYNAFAIQYWSGNTILALYVNDVWNTQINNVWGYTLKDFTFTCDATKTLNGNSNYNLYIIEYNEITLQDVFYNAVDKVTESPLFSWATNSVIYTTMNATCTQLSITAPFIPLILSYWLIISVIYFLYDIALMLIWLLHDKIHEMRDSLA